MAPGGGSVVVGGVGRVGSGKVARAVGVGIGVQRGQ